MMSQRCDVEILACHVPKSGYAEIAPATSYFTFFIQSTDRLALVSDIATTDMANYLFRVSASDQYHQYLVHQRVIAAYPVAHMTRSAGSSSPSQNFTPSCVK